MLSIAYIKKLCLKKINLCHCVFIFSSFRCKNFVFNVKEISCNMTFIHVSRKLTTMSFRSCLLIYFIEIPWRLSSDLLCNFIFQLYLCGMYVNVNPLKTNMVCLDIILFSHEKLLTDETYCISLLLLLFIYFLITIILSYIYSWIILLHVYDVHKFQF